MLGLKSGVAKRICDIQPKAYPTHCHAHSLSLCVKDTTSSSKILSDVMDISRKIAVLVKFSLKREKLLGDIKETLNKVITIKNRGYQNLVQRDGPFERFASSVFWRTMTV